MKILHTSDWHLGAMLYQEKRYDEFDAALEWMLKLLQKEAIDILLIAGDVFDTATPSNRAMDQYCQFLSEAVKGGIKQIIITAGNHDSVSFLEAPKQVLRHLNIHVIGKADPEFKDQLIPLKDEKENIQAVICAVPFLRDRDIRQAAAGEDLDTLYQKRYDGVINYYKAICGKASELYPGVPQIVTGHFFAAGGKLSKDHTMGNLFSINVKELPDTISYLALGHLHTPQTVAGKSNFRYSGSLLKMDFGDHDVAKEMLILDTANLSAEPEKIVKMPQKTASKKKAKAAAKAKYRVSSVASILMLVAFLVGVVCLNIALRVEISEVNSDIIDAKSELSAVSGEQTRLMVEFERMVSFENLEEAALNLGMKKTDKSQIVYIRINDTNKAVDSNGNILTAENE